MATKKVKKMVEVEEDVEIEEEVVVETKPIVLGERPEIIEQHRLMVEKGLADQKLAQSRK